MPTLRWSLWLLLSLVLTRTAVAQSAAQSDRPSSQPPVQAPAPSASGQDSHGRSYETGSSFGLLPGARTAWAIADLIHPLLVSDRTDAGGVTGGDPVRVGGYGSAWSQVTYRYGDIDITNPRTGGTPLLFPSLDGLAALTVTSAARSAAESGVGPSFGLVPIRPGSAWHGEAQTSVTPGGWQSIRDGVAPRLSRISSWADAGAHAGGRLGQGARPVTLFLSGRSVRARWHERADPTTLASDVRLLTTRLARPYSAGELSATLAVNDETRPYAARARFADRDVREANRAVVTGATWRGRGLWSTGGGYRRWSTAPATTSLADGGVIERLLDGPPRQLLDAGPSVGHALDVNASTTRPTRTWRGLAHELTTGASLAHARLAIEPGRSPAFAEVVDGQPARVWDVRRLATGHLSATTVGAFISDRATLGPTVSLRGGVRLDGDRGIAEGAATGIRWLTVSPRADLRWQPFSGTVVTAAYGRYAHRLTLDTLAVGDPAGPAGVMYRWDDVNGDGRAQGPERTAVAAIGACCNGGVREHIDAGLARPTTREFLLGLAYAAGPWTYSITGVDRRESNQLFLQEVGVTAADYTTRLIADPGIDLAASTGPPSLPIASRNGASFLRDASVLTNGPSVGRYQGAEIEVERRFARGLFAFGGMTHRAEAPGASRGYRSDENDPGLVGEVGLDPNAALNATGRLFFDRAYVMKVRGHAALPHRLTLAAAARYQDGQPFTRVVVADGLGQGRDLVPANPRGGQRFTYMLTLDARVEKQFPLGGTNAVALVAEVFNLLDLAHEVEEYVVTGPRFRTVTAVQPPRAARLGVRLSF